MATVTFIPYKRQSAGSSKAVCDYVSQDMKTQMEDGAQLLSGQNCCPQLAAQEFLATREMYRKDSPVHFYHYIQSFHPDEPVSPTQAHEIAKEFAAKAWPESEVLIATHIDAPHIHSHFIVNAVCQDSGKMLRQGPRTLAKLRPISDEICMEHGLSVLENDRQKESQGMGTREYRSAARGESWKFRLMNAIDDCMKYASTREDFVSLMQSEDYEIKWTDTRKNITYTTPDGNKCCDDKLHDNKYLKENMIYEFNIRKTALSGRAEAEKCSGFEYGEGCGLSGHGDREKLGRSNKPSQPDLGTTGRIDGGSKELLTGKDMEKYLEIVNQNSQKQMDELTMTVSQFSRQAGSLSESFSSASDKLVRRTNSALTEILQDTNSGLTDIFENSKSEQQAVQRDIREIVTQLKQCLKLWTPRILVGLVSVTVILSLLSRLLS